MKGADNPWPTAEHRLGSSALHTVWRQLYMSDVPLKHIGERAIGVEDVGSKSSKDPGKHADARAGPNSV